MISIEKITEENVGQIEEKTLIYIEGKKEMVDSKHKEGQTTVIKTIRKQGKCMEECTYVLEKEGLTLFRYKGYSKIVCEYRELKEKILTNSENIPWEQL